MGVRRKNGAGGIVKMKGKRRTPFRVRITEGWLLDMVDGKTKQQVVTLGLMERIFQLLMQHE